MDKELARYVARTAFQSAAELNDLIPFLKEFCGEDDFVTYEKAIASASAGIGIEILKRVFSEFPDLETEFEDKIKKYGKLI